MQTTDNKIIAKLKRHGYKITPQRCTILNVIASSNEHLTPIALYERVHEANPEIGMVTIYRTLDILSKLDLICKIHIDGNSRSYLIRRPSEHHHHLVCTGCGSVVNFSDCNLMEIENSLSATTGFQIASHILEFSGYCPKCQIITWIQFIMQLDIGIELFLFWKTLFN